MISGRLPKSFLHFFRLQTWARKKQPNEENKSSELKQARIMLNERTAEKARKKRILFIVTSIKKFMIQQGGSDCVQQ